MFGDYPLVVKFHANPKEGLLNYRNSTEEGDSKANIRKVQYEGKLEFPKGCQGVDIVFSRIAHILLTSGRAKNTFIIFLVTNSKDT